MHKKQKILFDGRFLSLSHAGLGRYSCEILKNILKTSSDFSYTVLVTKGTKFDNDLSRVIYEQGENVEIIETDIAHYSIGEQTKLSSLIKSIRSDLVHFPHFNHPALYNGRFVVTIHDLTLSQYSERGGLFKRSLYRIVINHAAKASRKILAVSNFVRDEIAQEFKLPKSKIVTTYNGIDDIFTKITNPRTLKKVEKYGLMSPYILSVGQWRSHKNLLRLVRAFAMVIKNPKIPRNLELVFAGRDDPKYPELKALVRDLELDNRVKFTGFVADEDLPVIYNNALAFCFPSLSEGFGLPGLEAQACGTPVISSDKTCLPEIYGKAALYFDPESIDDIAHKTLEVYREILYNE